ncbi:MAG: sulfurtransferase [Planctomycetales bacterium]|nr:sulfurtransferase [Planctomycetales bacterium]
MVHKAHSPGFLKLADEARARVREVGIADVKARLDRGETFHFVDVREDSEWDEDRCRGASHLGRGVLERDVETTIPAKDADIVLYCGGGFRSALAAEVLQRMGYRRVASMAGGIRAWREAGYPLEKGKTRGRKR